MSSMYKNKYFLGPCKTSVKNLFTKTFQPLFLQKFDQCIFDRVVNKPLIQYNKHYQKLAWYLQPCFLKPIQSSIKVKGFSSIVFIGQMQVNASVKSSNSIVAKFRQK